MFDDQQSNQITDNQSENTSDAGSAPTLGLGTNPDPAAVPDEAPAAAPTVVMPTLTHDNTAAITTTDDSTASSSAPDSTDALESIKREALAQLSPLVHKLDQSPEEKYKTIMMMIQASDNKDLIQEAYDAAQQITDEKAKAEALLNIVNEINYFAQKS